MSFDNNLYAEDMKAERQWISDEVECIAMFREQNCKRNEVDISERDNKGETE